MLRRLLKRHLLILIPCILAIGAIIPIATFAKAASSDQVVADNANIVKDGGFEIPLVRSGSFDEYSAGQSFGHWTVGSGSIDLVRSYWVSAHGAQSVDLDGSNAGTIYQNLSTVAGTNYALSFDMAGNPVCGPAVKQMQVWWGTTLVDTLSFDTTGHSTDHMGWQHHTYIVPATGTSTSLSFVSLTDSLCGPALDAVAAK